MTAARAADRVGQTVTDLSPTPASGANVKPGQIAVLATDDVRQNIGVISRQLPPAGH